MRCVAIYDRMEDDEPLVAFCVLQSRGEYELLNHRFDDGSYRYKDVTATEVDNLRHAFEVDVPIKDIQEFCLTERFCEWTGISY